MHSCVQVCLFVCLFVFFNFLFYLGVHSDVIIWSPLKPRPGMYQTVWLYGWVFIAYMFQASHKQWEVAILILINTSASIKFKIVSMNNWLNLNKPPCWDSIRDPFVSEANPWAAGLRLCIKLWYALCRRVYFTYIVRIVVHNVVRELMLSENLSLRDLFVIQTHQRPLGKVGKESMDSDLCSL